MSFFWSDLRIDEEKVNVEWLETRVKRSGEAPLAITLTETAFETGSLPTLRDICHVLIPLANRWESLDLQGVPVKICHVLFEQLRKKPLSQLHTLSVGPQCDVPHHPPKPIKLSAYELPALKHLVLYSSAFRESSAPFAQLLTIRLAAKNLSIITVAQAAEKAITILQAAPLLRGLSIEGPHSVSHEQVGRKYKKVTLATRPRHHSLEILDTSFSAIDIVLQSVELPALRRLPQRYNWPLHLLYDTFRDYGMPQLECISIANDGHRPLAEVLAAVSRSPIQNLSIYNYDLTNTTIDELASQFPNLETLEIVRCSGLTPDIVEAMIKTHPPKLKKLVLSRIPDLGASTLEQQELFRAADIFIGSSRSPNYKHTRSPDGWARLLC